MVKIASKCSPISTQESHKTEQLVSYKPRPDLTSLSNHTSNVILRHNKRGVKLYLIEQVLFLHWTMSEYSAVFSPACHYLNLIG